MGVLATFFVFLHLVPGAHQTAPAQSPTVEGAREARLRPFTVEDALYFIPGVAWQMQRVGDLNGDGIDDLIVQRGGVLWDRGLFAEWTSRTGWGHPDSPARIDAVSAVDGEHIRTLWTCEDMEAATWDAGGDLDGDSLPDLVLGREGAAVAVSGATGTLLREIREPSDNPYTRSVAFLGDLDGDGRDEFVVGAPGGPEHVGTVTLYAGRDGAPIWSLDGQERGDGFGLSVCAVGDTDRDGSRDILIASVPRSGRPLMLVSSADGAAIEQLEDKGGPFGPAGDVDGDGVDDLFLGALEDDTSEISASVDVVAPGSVSPLFELRLPDYPFTSPYSRVIPLEDMDGDHVPDFLMGNPDFNVAAEGPDNPPSHQDIEAPDLRAMTLSKALALESDPWCAFTWHSGTAWVRSGRTQEVLMGVWGPPGRRQGMGLAGCSVPDLDGDGWPELAVVDMDGAYVFPGPGVPDEDEDGK